MTIPTEKKACKRQLEARDALAKRLQAGDPVTLDAREARLLVKILGEHRTTTRALKELQDHSNVGPEDDIEEWRAADAAEAFYALSGKLGFKIA